MYNSNNPVRPLQTISIPYQTETDEERAFIADARRVFSSMVRTALANATDADGKRRSEKVVRTVVKARFGEERMDAWAAHSATQVAMGMLDAQRKADERHRRAAIRRMKNLSPKQQAFLLAQPIRPTTVVMGGRKFLERRSKGLISNAEFREARLHPLVSRGDKTQVGNRNFRLSPDGMTCTFSMLAETRMRTVEKKRRDRSVEMVEVQEYVHRTAILHLAPMKGRAGKILRQVAKLAAGKAVNVQFSLDATHLHVTVDPEDLPDHPERRKPFVHLPGRVMGVDGNPSWIGLTVIENGGDPMRLSDVRVVDHALIDMTDAVPGNRVLTREVLAGVCKAMIDLCRRTGCGTICLEKGLGHLCSRGPSTSTNRLINGWARQVLLQMLRRKAALAGIKVVEVWGGYSTTIGNTWFELPDACASAAEIARRGLTAVPAKKRLRSKAARIAEAIAAKAAKEAAKAARDAGTTVPVRSKETLPEFEREGMPPHVAELLARTERLLLARREAERGRTSRGAAGARADLRKERGHGAGTPARPKGVPIEDWTGLHRGIKAAAVGVRRPHPGRVGDPRCAVRRLTRRGRPGRVLRVSAGDADSPRPMSDARHEAVAATIRFG